MLHSTQTGVLAPPGTLPITVALVYRNFGARGSLERDHIRLASELSQRGLVVHCFGIPSRRTSIVDGVVHHDVTPLVASHTRFGYAVECASFAHEATRQIRRLRSDFTLVDVSGSDCWEQDVVTVHGVTRAEQRRTALLSPHDRIRTALSPVLAPRQIHGRVVERLQFRNPRLQRVIARTSQVKDDLVGVHGFPGERIDVIPYAVDVRQFASGARGWLRPHLGIPNDAHVVSFVGRLVREKGLALAMAAIRAAPNAHLVAVGGGDPATFVDDARRAGVADRVHFLPYTDRPQDILADSDVFAFPSAQDVWGIPVIEAMAASVPVLCSDAAGASNAVRAADAGVVTPPDNEAFARALRDLLASPHLRSRLGRNGAAAAQAYAPDRHAQATLHCYGDAIERRLRAAEGVERASLRRAITALRGLS